MGRWRSKLGGRFGGRFTFSSTACMEASSNAVAACTLMTFRLSGSIAFCNTIGARLFVGVGARKAVKDDLKLVETCICARTCYQGAYRL